jgi:hypothetical protein
MASKVKTWVWIVIGIVAVCILCVIGLAAAGLWFVKSHVDIRQTSATMAASDFDTVLHRYAGQKPLIELDDRGNFVHANTDRPNGTQRPESLNIMAFNPRDDKVVRMEVPFWLLRLKHGTRFGVSDLDLVKLRLTVEDLERYGPTLIVDHQDSEGARVVVWSE